MKGLRSMVAFVLIGLLWPSLPARGEDPTAKSLIGTWRAHVSTPWGPGFAETILMKNGRFSKTFKVAEMKTLDTGKYTVGQGYIHFDIEDHEPKVYKGKPMQWVKSETVFFQMAGPDRMLCEDRITGGRWEAYRVR
jgi:hypothetical protein